MAAFTFYEMETAPAESKPLLDNSLKSFGMIPGLHKVLAGSPKTLEAYQRMHDLFQETSFDATELTVVWQTINVEHGCTYCVPGHTAIAYMMKVDEEVITALRDESPLADPKLEALRSFTLALVRQRGHVEDATVQAFLDAGYTTENIVEILLGLAQKVISNYANHLAGTPVDEPFKKFAWEKTTAVAAE